MAELLSRQDLCGIVALAVDFDGTVAEGGALAATTSDALSVLRHSGYKLFMVTGRVQAQLAALLPQEDLFDAYVLENGAVIANHIGTAGTAVCEPWPEPFLDEVARLTVRPLTLGQRIISVRREHTDVLEKLLERHALTASIIYNKADVMLLPASVNKAFGLERLCRLQGIDPSTLVGVGDAENDLDFLDYCGVSVAVANALPEVKSRCRFETRESNGRGVIEVIRKLLDRG